MPGPAERSPRPAARGGAGDEGSAIAPGPLTFTFGTWFTWTAAGIAFPALGVALVAAAGPLAQGAYESAPVFVATHLAALAWGTLTVLGAAAQMAPVLLGARVRGEATIPWLYVLSAGSIVTVVLALAAGRYDIAAAGGAGVHLAAWWFAAVLAATAISAGPKRAVLSPHIPVALLCFILVSLWGTLLAVNLRWTFWPGILIGHRGLVVHMVLGLGGWFGLMVIGVFYRLGPLIHGARVADARRGAAILVFSIIAIVSAIVGVMTPAAWLCRPAALSAAAALVLFAWEIRHVLVHRRGRAPDLNVAHWYAVAAYSLALAALASAWAAGLIQTDPPERLGEVMATVFLCGWVTQAIVGQLYKVTPFLMWYYRATIPDVSAIPRLPAPYYPRPGRAVFWLSNLGSAGTAAAIWAGAPRAAEGGGVLFAAGAAVLAYMLAYRWLPPAATNRLLFEWRWRL